MAYNIFLLGRVLLGGFFIFSGYLHFKDVVQMTHYALSKNIPAAKVVVYISGIILMLSGLGIVFSIFPLISLWLAVLFLIPTTFMMHNFWRQKDTASFLAERNNFAKNLALIGALFIIIVLTSTFLIR